MYGNPKLQKSYSRHSLTQRNISVKVTSGLKKLRTLNKTPKITVLQGISMLQRSLTMWNIFVIVLSWTGKRLNFEHWYSYCRVKVSQNMLFRSTHLQKIYMYVCIIFLFFFEKYRSWVEDFYFRSPLYPLVIVYTIWRAGDISPVQLVTKTTNGVN